MNESGLGMGRFEAAPGAGGLELRCWQVECIGFVVDTHGAGTSRRLHDLFYLELPILFGDDGQSSIAGASECVAIVELGGIDARADGQVG